MDEQSPGFVPAAGCTKLVLGTVSERPKDHVSKTCVGVNSTVGSNPTGTATRKSPENPVLTGVPGLFSLLTGQSGNAAVTGTRSGVVSNRRLPEWWLLEKTRGQ